MTTDKLTNELTKWQTLIDLLTYFRTEERCREFLLKILYPDGLRCPKCGGLVIYRCGRVYHCDECNSTFSIKVGTIFQSTKLPLRKWFAAIWLTINNKKGISAAMLQRELGISYVTAWHMLQKLRITLPQSEEKLEGAVQIDNAYIGGQLRWRAVKPEGYSRGDYLCNKISVVGLSADRMVIKQIDEGNWASVRPVLRKYLTHQNIVYTDQGKEFMKIGRAFGNLHYVCNHDIKEFKAESGATTNRVEGCWSHIKRHQRGIYHKLTHKYAQRYIDEFVWRWNTIGISPQDRVRKYFEGVRVVVTWSELRTK